jgi:hypothetical protein
MRYSCGGNNQGYFFWLQNTEGEPVVGVFATNHQPQVLPPYFAARKNNPGNNSSCHAQQIGLALEVGCSIFLVFVLQLQWTTT